VASIPTSVVVKAAATVQPIRGELALHRREVGSQRGEVLPVLDPQQAHLLAHTVDAPVDVLDRVAQALVSPGRSFHARVSERASLRPSGPVPEASEASSSRTQAGEAC